MSSSQGQASKSAIWWTNGILFVTIHIAAFLGAFYHPYSITRSATLILAFLLWQAACFGITIGYHRLHSHKAFKIRIVPKVVLALLGASAFQGSIRWWCLRHRLHHRYTDDPIHDPYSATRGLLWSHMGWIFFKPTYERMSLIDKADLDRDAVVVWQHRHYVPLAIFTSFVFPTMVGWLWRDPLGAFIWGGLVVRVAVWHCTFLINSLAHWDGLQPYSDENTSRTNLVLALLTCGEGNHNFHAFPHDFRSGPAPLDWDPSKWIILLLYKLSLASRLQRARNEDLVDALSHMADEKRHSHGDQTYEDGDLPTISIADVYQLMKEETRTILPIEDYIIDASGYLLEHPGGAGLLHRYSLRKRGPDIEQELTQEAVLQRHEEATWAFSGGINSHSRIAKARLRSMAIGKLVIE
ncbi:hypothetical protein BDW22DRAFT_1319775 [Trametopsis cervina]|nr:hypothetical protein BDW22DRAFT_1319775 [Trametopsis cervina]